MPGPWREIAHVELNETKTKDRGEDAVALRVFLVLKECGHTVVRHLGASSMWYFRNIPKKVRCETCWELANMQGKK